MKAPPLLALLAAIAGLAAGAPAGAMDTMDVPELCRVPEGLIRDIAQFSHSADRVARERKLVIVAIGGASTQGLGASSPAAAWPTRLADILSRRLDAVEIKVFNFGVRRQTAKAAQERFARDIASLHPSLVIWETGTVEAALTLDPGEFIETLAKGMDDVGAMHADLILMDPQYARGSALLINFQPFMDAMRQAAQVPGVNLFPRHEIMLFWDGEGRLVPRTREEMTRGNDQIYGCVAELLAEVIDRGLRRGAQSTTRN
ncbi:MAG: SGNH/GDSL hydrolase family protein [Rhodospirillales bacterium]